VNEFGGIDVLVNNAGVHGESEPLESTTLASWDRSIAILQTGVFLGMKSAAPALLESPYGSVVNISSIFRASGGFGSSSAYHAAKGAVRTLTKTAALHWAEAGIRVNSIHPGFIDTPLLRPDSLERRTGSGDMHQAIVDATPMGRLGRPEEVAAGVAYLASDDATFVTGSELYIDGGYMAR
jgi:NAD(P)-dependent dehydrogenase (short-subunit alcohol dehydrogenase family)